MNTNKNQVPTDSHCQQNIHVSKKDDVMDNPCGIDMKHGKSPLIHVSIYRQDHSV